MIKTFSWFGIIVVLTSCYSTTTTDSKTISPSQVYQSYYIDVDANEKKASCTAIFTITDRAGNKILLSEPASVKINGEQMLPIDKLTRGTIYPETVAMTSGRYTFEYTDQNGKAYTNSVNVSQDLDLPLPTAIKLGEVIQLSTSSVRLQDVHRFELNLIDEAEKKLSFSLFANDMLPTVHISETDSMISGPLRAYYSLSGFTDLQQTTEVGGEGISFTYRSEEMVIDLLE